MRKSIIVSLAFAAGALVWVPFSAGAQEPAASGSKPGKSQAHPVTLPVTVRDKKGALVTNLQKSDFTLTQDGRPQVIQSLSQQSTLPLRIGILVDTNHSMNAAMPEERKAAEQLIDAVLPESGDTRNQVFLIHFDREVELLEDFTSSREKLHRELDEMSSTRPAHDESTGPETTSDSRENSSARRSRSGTQLYDAIYLASDELMKSKDGRKVLVVFSDGADHGSKETLNDAIDAADRANLEIFTIFFKGQPERDLAQELPGSRRRGGMGGGWPGGGGGGYPGGGGGYPGGGRRNPEPTSSAGVDGKKIMEQIAARTGGHAYEAKKPADLEPIHKLIDEELRSQYLLTYVPDKPGDEGEFHKIALKAGKEDLTVSVPEGFYTPEHK